MLTRPQQAAAYHARKRRRMLLAGAYGSAEGAATTAELWASAVAENGTLWWVVTQSAVSPTAAQIQAGTDESDVAADADSSQAVTTGGKQIVSVTGLTTATTYYGHLVHTNPGGRNSNVLTTPAFTTA